MSFDINYVIYLIIGAIILPLQYYFSKNKQYKICSLIPTIPLLGITGLLFILFHNGNIHEYLYNIIIFVICAFILYSIILSGYYFTGYIWFSLLCGLIIWGFIVYNVLNFKG